MNDILIEGLVIAAIAGANVAYLFFLLSFIESATA